VGERLVSRGGGGGGVGGGGGEARACGGGGGRGGGRRVMKKSSMANRVGELQVEKQRKENAFNREPPVTTRAGKRRTPHKGG